MSAKPSIFQFVVVGFALLSVAFVSVSTVVAVATTPSPVQADPPATAGRVSLSTWSTAAIAEHFGTARAAGTIRAE